MNTEKLKDDGYFFDRDNDWWERTWTTNEGKESIREIFQPLESGKWKKLMIGYGIPYKDGVWDIEIEPYIPIDLTGKVVYKAHEF